MPYRQTPVSNPGTLPFGMNLELTIRDTEAIAELERYDDPNERQRYATDALRIGLMALRQARGQVDADMVRREGEKLIGELERQLSSHQKTLNERMTLQLKEYFDPQNGRLHERLTNLVRKDGELEQSIRRLVGTEDSELRRTLIQHVGKESELFQLLDPQQKQGLVSVLNDLVSEQMQRQKDQIVGQFSLDDPQSALTRFLKELTDKQGDFSGQLQQKVSEAVDQLSLDNEDSALNRLVRNVTQAQRTISAEFSLDEESSALSRLKRMMETTNQTISNQLTLDEETSALSRLKRELTTMMADQEETSRKFQEEVRVVLESLKARKQESEKSTRHGLEFETAVGEFLQHEAQKAGDFCTATGATTGVIRHCKKGDYVVELSPDSVAAGACIVLEAKEVQGYTLTNAREEMEEARKNRQAQVGVFIFSRKTAPEGMEYFQRYGQDIYVVWDAEQTETDLYLTTALTLARALCVRKREHSAEQQADFDAIERAIADIEKQSRRLDEMQTWSKTISNNGEKILNSVDQLRKTLNKQAETLRERVGDLKIAFSSSDQ